MTLPQTLICSQCKSDFTWVPNSTIKPKLCQTCQRNKDAAKKREYNKKMLSQSHFNAKSGIMKNKTPKYVPKNKTSLNARKNGKSRAMDRADQWFSRFVRINFSEQVTTGGLVICKCYTCDNFHAADEIQCGHWQRRGYKATRFEPDNARPQCVKCNKWRSGEPEKFEINLINEVGEKKVVELKQLAQSDFKDSEYFYREQAAKYRKLTNEVIKNKNIKKWW